MAQPTTIHSSYAGMSQDYARDQMPPSALWNLIDYIPNILGAPLRKRGGYVNASSACSSASLSSGTFLRRVMYGNTDQGGSQLLALDSVTATSGGAGLWKADETTGAVTFVGSVTAASAATATTAATGIPNATVGDPVFFGKQWFIPIGYTDAFVASGTATGYNSMRCTVYNGSTLVKIDVASTQGGAKGARYAAVYRSRVALGNTPETPRRIWWNKAGDKKATKFDDQNGWMDMPGHITGMIGLTNSMVVFGADIAWRIRGSVPPPGSDFVVDELGDQGCADSRSIAEWAGKAVFANTNGVFLTDGIDVIDLTQNAGLVTYYRNLLTTFTSAWTLRGEVYRNYYFLTILNASGTFVDCLVCDLRSRAFFRLSNFNFTDFTTGTGAAFQQFYGTNANSTRIRRLTDIFSPAAANKADADGTNILPVVEYPARRGFSRQGRRYVPTSGLTHWKRLYLTYDLRDAASDNPTFQMAYVTSPESTSYSTLADTLAETTTSERGAFDFGPVGERGGAVIDALGLKVTQTAPSSDTRVYGLDAENEAIEGSRL